MKILFVFIDGLGLGSTTPETNPIYDSRYPQLQALLKKSRPIDACLDVEGKPQSATGQATLLTGVNAAKAMGRHIEGFPPPALKKLIEHENIFKKLKQLDKKCTFANSYWIEDPHKIPLRRQSVTTVMTLSALKGVRHKEELMAGNAVNHDVTRWTMHTRGYEGPLISPEEAANHLLRVAEDHHFTLYEYFLTDRAGHSGKPNLLKECLGTLERFLPLVAEFGQRENCLFLLCSDHGNIEDNTTFTHTQNPVPLIALGAGAEHFANVKTLPDVTPAILNTFS